MTEISLGLIWVSYRVQSSSTSPVPSMQVHGSCGSESSGDVEASCCSYCGSALVAGELEALFQHSAVCSASPKAVLGSAVRAEGKGGAWMGSR